MARVPGNVLAFPTPQIADADLLMAAAIMDEQGRLFEPELPTGRLTPEVGERIRERVDKLHRPNDFDRLLPDSKPNIPGEPVFDPTGRDVRRL